MNTTLAEPKELTELIANPTTESASYCDVHAVSQQSTVETLVYNRC
jgi:hypothetical protein